MPRTSLQLSRLLKKITINKKSYLGFLGSDLCYKAEWFQEILMFVFKKAALGVTILKLDCIIIVVIITCFSKCDFVRMLEHDITSNHT